MPKIGPLLAQGRTASIYSWRTGYILKLFRPEFDRTAVEQEQHIARAVHAAGAPAPGVCEIVVVGAQFGLVYEQVFGVPMSDVFFRQPRRADSLGRRMARLHVHLHRLRLPNELPEQHVMLEEKISHASALTLPARRAALNALADLPSGNSLCHGDFHPSNILIGPKSDKVIDWSDACKGSPIADVARTMTILLGEAQRSSGHSADTRDALLRLCNAYLTEYRLQAGLNMSELDLWRPIVAAARLSEGLDSLAPWLLAQIAE